MIRRTDIRAVLPVLVLALALGSVRDAVSSEAFEFSGPLRIADQFLLTVGALMVEPLPLELVGEGVWQAELAVSAGNTFTRSKSVQTALEERTERGPVNREFLDRVERESPVGESLFFIDGETLRTEIRVRRGLGNGLELEMRLPVVALYGGWMDTLLEEFHSAVSFDQDGRLGVPRNEQALFLDLGDQDLDVDSSSYLTVADPLLAVRGRKRLRRDGHLLVWDAAVKIPTADEGRLAGSGSMDLAVTAQWSACSPRRCRFGALNLRNLGEWKALGLSSRLVPGVYLGLEQRWRGMSWVVQLMVAGSPLGGIQVENLDSETWQLCGGIHKRLGEVYSMTAVVTENAAHFENGPDLTFHWLLRRGF